MVLRPCYRGKSLPLPGISGIYIAAALLQTMAGATRSAQRTRLSLFDSYLISTSTFQIIMPLELLTIKTF
jgi:hypothetical protein